MQCLKWQKLNLNLFQILLTCIFFKKGTRGGISYISNRYSKANNIYLKFYNSKQESKHVIYLDVNNLFLYTMSKFPPISRFKWIDI